MIYFNPYFPLFHSFKNNNNKKSFDLQPIDSSQINQANLDNSNFKKSPLADVYNLFSSTDNLIILGLILVLLKQKNTSKALLLCLILLLFDE